MYERTERDEQTLSAAGFEELDAHWFRYRDTDMHIQMPNNPYYADPTCDTDWGVYADMGESCPMFVSAFQNLEDAISCCMRSAQPVNY